MPHDTGLTVAGGARARERVSLYDRFARLYDITFKFNGYGRSIERYPANR